MGNAVVEEISRVAEVCNAKPVPITISFNATREMQFVNFRYKTHIIIFFSHLLYSTAQTILTG